MSYKVRFVRKFIGKTDCVYLHMNMTLPFIPSEGLKIVLGDPVDRADQYVPSQRQITVERVCYNSRTDAFCVNCKEVSCDYADMDTLRQDVLKHFVPLGWYVADDRSKAAIAAANPKLS